VGVLLERQGEARLPQLRARTHQVPDFSNMSWTLGVKLAPRGEF
jgi:hypothetical protein